MINFKIKKLGKEKKLFKIFLKDYLIEINQDDKKIIKKKISNILSNIKKNKFYLFYKKEKVGFIIYSVFKNVENNKVCIINDFFIHKKFRKENFGYIFIKYLLNKGKLRGIKEFRIEIIKKNFKVLKFWKKFKLIDKSKVYTLSHK